MWNYRVVRKRHIRVDAIDQKERVDYTYAIHEAFYDKKGHVGAITDEPVEPFGENIEELRHSWVMMAEAFGQPILDYENVPERGHKRKKDPTALDEIVKEIESSRSELNAWEHVERDLEGKPGPFDEEDYRKRKEEERIAKERIHGEVFVGTPTLEALIGKIYSDYLEYIKRDRAEDRKGHGKGKKGKQSKTIRERR